MKSKYSKFIILGSARTGSNWLIDLLDSHPNIRAFGEMFDPSYIIKNDAGAIGAACYLSRIFKTYPVRTKAVGFKIFYNQAGEISPFSRKKSPREFHAKLKIDGLKKRWKIFNLYLLLLNSRGISNKEYIKRVGEVWNLLKYDEKIKVVHLKRKNYLGKLISEQKAIISNEWKWLEGGDYDKIRLELSSDQCLNFFEKSRKDERRGDSFFQHHPKIVVFYEDLQVQTDKEIKKILSFLDVPQKNLSSSMRKQNAQLLSESISNYWELKDKFKDTNWAEFFEE